MRAARAVRYAVTMWRALSEHLREPGPARPKRVSSADLAIAITAALLTLAEIALRGRGVPTVALAVGLVIAVALAFRRVRPLPSLLGAFVAVNAASVAQRALGARDQEIFSSAFILLLPFALLRYGSGRDVAIGLSVMLGTYAVSATVGELRGAQEAIGALVVLFFPAAIGASLRFRERAHRVEVDRAQLRERQMLARELHDTVAHHVAAIVIQSQAAGAVLAARPDAARAALRAIEQEASRALLELRSLVGALRDDGPAALAPQGTASAIEALVREAGEHATFEQAGELDTLAPSVGLALHRIARESLHNARTHARGVTAILVRLTAERDTVRLVVENDGAPPEPSSRGGFGLVGMRERATLLGGTFDAGPRPAGGWRVVAVLPRDGAPS
jgi:signal transduction histidine kinase